MEIEVENTVANKAVIGRKMSPIIRIRRVA